MKTRFTECVPYGGQEMNVNRCLNLSRTFLVFKLFLRIILKYNEYVKGAGLLRRRPPSADYDLRHWRSVNHLLPPKSSILARSHHSPKANGGH